MKLQFKLKVLHVIIQMLDSEMVGHSLPLRREVRPLLRGQVRTTGRLPDDPDLSNVLLP